MSPRTWIALTLVLAGALVEHVVYMAGGHDQVAVYALYALAVAGVSLIWRTS